MVSWYKERMRRQKPGDLGTSLTPKGSQALRSGNEIVIIKNFESHSRIAIWFCQKFVYDELEESSLKVINLLFEGYCFE